MERKWNGMNWIRKDLRLAIYIRDGFSCMYCGEALEDGIQLTLDHVHPVNGSSKPDNRPSNLVTSCQRCNSAKGDRNVKGFCVAVAEYLNHGLNGYEIYEEIEFNLAQQIDEYRAEAKQILARRPNWMRALAEASR